MELIATAWVKNEAPYLAEFIEFHLLQGFTKFLVYDNKSTDQTAQILEPYIKQGIVEHRFYPPEITQRNNFHVMETTIKEFSNTDCWLFHHSVDERMFCPDGKLISELLTDYTSYGGLSVAWEEFNSAGKLTKEPGLISDRFTVTCKDTANHIKTCIMPRCAITHEGDPHNFIFKPGFKSVDENKKEVKGPWNTANPYTFNLIKNHHYRTMSLQEFNEKQEKGVLDHPGQENRRRPDADQQWDWCHNRAVQGHNDTLQRYSYAVKQALISRYKDYPETFKLIKEWYDIRD